MAEPATNDHGETIRVVLDAVLRTQFEDWRRRQPRIPSISEGVRRLLSRALVNDHVAA